jgi:hypothetical protein
MSEPEMYRIGLADGANDERVSIAQRLEAFKASAEKQGMNEWYVAGIASCLKLLTFQPDDLDSKDAE